MFFDFFHYVSDLESMLTLKKIKKTLFFCFLAIHFKTIMQKTKKHSRVLQFFRFQNKKTKKSQGKPKKANLSSRPKVLLKVFVFLFFFLVLPHPVHSICAIQIGFEDTRLFD